MTQYRITRYNENKLAHLNSVKQRKSMGKYSDGKILIHKGKKAILKKHNPFVHLQEHLLTLSFLHGRWQEVITNMCSILQNDSKLRKSCQRI